MVASTERSIISWQVSFSVISIIIHSLGSPCVTLLDAVGDQAQAEEAHPEAPAQQGVVGVVVQRPAVVAQQRQVLVGDVGPGRNFAGRSGRPG